MTFAFNENTKQNIWIFPLLLFVYLLFSTCFKVQLAWRQQKKFVQKPSVIYIPSLAFCDEEVITKRHEEHDNEVTSRQEMYSEQRKEMMNKQVTNLHQSKQEQHVMTSSTHVTEAQEWQQIAKKEKSYSEFAEQSHFSMVRLVWIYVAVCTNTFF